MEARVGQALVGTASAAVDRVAEEIAREALADGSFRRTLRELVRLRSQELLEQLLRNGGSRDRRSAPAKRLRKRRSS